MPLVAEFCPNWDYCDYIKTAKDEGDVFPQATHINALGVISASANIC